MQSERHPGVNDAGFRTCRAVAAAPAPPAHTSHCRRSRGPANPYGTYRLDAGDRVRVILFGQDKLSRSYSVDSNGTVSLPLSARSGRGGLTTFELSTHIAAELLRKYIKDPKVSVEVEAYRPFFILGEVKRPGGYLCAMTVEAAVALAEGYTERAKKRMVRLTRRFNGVNSTVMVPVDYPVHPGDTIYVLERFF